MTAVRAAIAVALMAVALAVQSRGGDAQGIVEYLAAIDRLDADQVINNRRLMMNTIKCLLDEGPCSNQFRDIKKALPTILEDNCASCSKDQKNKFKKLIDMLRTTFPQEYQRIGSIFDPDGKYEKIFLKKINEK